jgi:hypothetical protein
VDSFSAKENPAKPLCGLLWRISLEEDDTKTSEEMFQKRSCCFLQGTQYVELRAFAKKYPTSLINLCLQGFAWCNIVFAKIGCKLLFCLLRRVLCDFERQYDGVLWQCHTWKWLQCNVSTA